MTSRLKLSLCLCAALAGTAAAQQGQAEPESVGDRFNRNNAAPGLQMGPWKATPTATLSGGYDDNVTTRADNERASPVVQLRGRLDVTNAEGDDYVTITADISQTWYTDAADLDHFDASGGVAFQSALSAYVRLRGSIGVSSGSAEATADDGIIVGGNFDPYVDLAKYLSVPASLGVFFDGGRYTLSASGDIVYTDYDPRVTEGGVLVGQAFRNGTNADLRVRAGYRFSPSTGIFAEGGYNIQSYDDDSANSTGWRAVAGAEFEFSRLLTGEIFAGYAAQDYELGAEVTGFTYGASLTWFATELMSLKLDARRDFGAEQTEIIGGVPVTSPVTRDSVSLLVEYEPLRQMLVRAQGGWRQVSYEGQARTDEGIFAGLGVDYVFTPNVRLNLDYRHDRTASDVAGDASRNLFMLGLTTGY